MRGGGKIFTRKGEDATPSNSPMHHDEYEQRMSKRYIQLHLQKWFTTEGQITISEITISITFTT